MEWIYKKHRNTMENNQKRQQSIKNIPEIC